MEGAYLELVAPLEGGCELIVLLLLLLLWPLWPQRKQVGCGFCARIKGSAFVLLTALCWDDWYVSPVARIATAVIVCMCVCWGVQG